MATLEQVKDVPFKVKMTETNAFVREIPYKDQAKKGFRLAVDFDKLANHALHNHYCISFIHCPFHLNFENLIAHFDWCCRYLYFNFEQSVLRLEIFTKLEQLQLDKSKIEYLIQALVKYPEAYEYDINEADHKQKWALLKKSNFKKCADFLQIAEQDKMQRSLLLEHLRFLLNKLSTFSSHNTQPVPPVSIPVKKGKYLTKIIPVKPKEREASLHNFLKLNEDLSHATCRQVIKFLYDMLEPCFRQPYSLEKFSDIFYKNDSPDLELVKKANLDNQSFMILFRELKNEKILSVSWQVVERKVKVFKSDGTPFSGFSQLSTGKINVKKRNTMKKALEPLFALINNDLLPRMKK